MGCAAAMEFGESGVEQTGAEAPVAPLRGDDKVFDEAAGPALHETDGLLTRGGDNEQGGVELFVLDERPPPLIEAAYGSAARGIGVAEQGMQFDLSLIHI